MGVINVINRPASECTGNHFYLGPTAVDLSPITDHAEALARQRSIENAIRKREAKMLKNWRSQDGAAHTIRRRGGFNHRASGGATQ